MNQAQLKGLQDMELGGFRKTSRLSAKEELLSKAELSIWLDSYDDIFSDFDPRPYSERVLSDDFITEAKKMFRETKRGKIFLKLLMPSAKRQQHTEEVITRNLHSHFHRIALMQKRERNRSVRRGIFLCTAGVLIMVFAAYIATIDKQSFLFSAIRVVLEPAGWFVTWYGLDLIFSNVYKKRSEYEYASRMATAEISFVSI